MIQEKRKLQLLENARRYRERHRDELNKRHRDRLKNDPKFKKEKNKYQKEWREKNKTKMALYKKKSILKNTYGLSLEEYESILKMQGGVCAICKTTRSILCVDHNHKTGKARGLLCHQCNRSLGMMKEDIVIFQNAITYIKKYDL